MPDGITSVLSAIGILLLVVLVFAGTYFTSRFLGGGMGNLQKVKNSRLEICERVTLGKDLHLLVVKTGGKAVLLGVTPQNITNLTELDPSLFDGLPETGGNPDFLAALKAAWKNTTGKEDGKP